MINFFPIYNFYRFIGYTSEWFQPPPDWSTDLSTSPGYCPAGLAGYPVFVTMALAAALCTISSVFNGAAVVMAA